jgi:hypothetical protein
VTVLAACFVLVIMLAVIVVATVTTTMTTRRVRDNTVRVVSMSAFRTLASDLRTPRMMSLLGAAAHRRALAIAPQESTPSPERKFMGAVRRQSRRAKHWRGGKMIFAGPSRRSPRLRRGFARSLTPRRQRRSAARSIGTPTRRPALLCESRQHRDGTRCEPPPGRRVHDRCRPDGRDDLDELPPDSRRRRSRGVCVRMPDEHVRFTDTANVVAARRRPLGSPPRDDDRAAESTTSPNRDTRPVARSRSPCSAWAEAGTSPPRTSHHRCTRARGQLLISRTAAKIQQPAGHRRWLLAW